MKLLSLDLTNWCQHTELHIEFPTSPLVRIDGKNNIGKSNLIRAIGRALAQGRSDFGDASAIQYGAKQATINLKARTTDQTVFSIERIITEKHSKSTLLVDGQDPITKSEEIEKKFTEWFGPTDVLLSLFIASQGEISRLLKTSGKQRLVEFIEICGFKTFLQKQSAINKLIKTFPALENPDSLLANINHQTTSLGTDIQTREAAKSALPPLAELSALIQRLANRKENLKQAKDTLEEKQKQLDALAAVPQTPLPDLQQLANSIAAAEQEMQEILQCLNHSSYLSILAQIQNLSHQINSTVIDNTDFQAKISDLNRELQSNHQELSNINSLAEGLTAKTQLLATENKTIAQAKEILAKAPGSPQWYQTPVHSLQNLNQLRVNLQRLITEQIRIQERLTQIAGITPPNEQELAKLKVSNSRLEEIQALRKHTELSDAQCIVCQQPWIKTAIQSRLQALIQEQANVEKALAQIPEIQKTFTTWQGAQTEKQALTELSSRLKQEINSLQLDINKVLQANRLSAEELATLPDILLAYKEVTQASQQNNTRQEQLITEISQLQLGIDQAAPRKAELEANNATSASRLTSLLSAQTIQQQKRAALTKLETEKSALEATLRTLSDHASPPASFQPQADYSALRTRQETKLAQARNHMTEASAKWAAAAEKTNQEATLKAQIKELTQKTAQPWTPAEESELSTAQTQSLTHQTLDAEISVFKQQITKLTEESHKLATQKVQFDKQTKDIKDLQAVSDFLAYDNGPQKFLEVFFLDVINQTNSLITEMGLPVTIEMGPNLEVIVIDEYKRRSSSKALGGGYANLIGVAFRLALQKLVIPKVNTIILDEPSTHVDEGNIELLIPFFEKLRSQLAVYGIEQCIVIDHHPAWKSSDVEIIRIGKP